MPLPVSHIDCSVVHHQDCIYVLGGQLYKHPYRYWLRLGNQIQRYHLTTGKWDIAGSLPYRVKTVNACIHRGKIIFSNGQRDVSRKNDGPGSVTNRTFVGRMEAFPVMVNSDLHPEFHGKQFLLITHEINLKGGPLILLELAKVLRRQGGMVRIVSLSEGVETQNLFLANHFPVLSMDYAHEMAVKSDFVIANTAVCGPWLRHLLMINPLIAEKTTWWIHENDPGLYGHFFLGTQGVKQVIFDSINQLETWVGDYLPKTIPAKVIYPGIRAELSHFSGNNSGFQVDMKKGGGLNVLSVGTISDAKGQKLLLQALAAMPEYESIRVILVGFENKTHVTKFYKGLSKKERFLVGKGKYLMIKQNDLTPFYRIADVFVMNSQNYGEPFGMATLEAMYFGLPILATKAGGTLEIVKEGENGFLHPTGKEGISILQDHLRLLNENVELRHQMGEKGQNIVSSKFSSALFSNQMTEYFKSFLSTS